MAGAATLAGLIKFINRSLYWSEQLEDLSEAHFGSACRTNRIEPEQIAELLGDDFSMTLFGCVLEDLMADGDDDDNVVVEYLRRRGYAEPGGAKRYMQALRHSTMSVYEVSDIVPGASFRARDLIRGGEPVLVKERSATRSMKTWDRMAARIVQEGKDMRMSGGVLVLPREVSEFLVAALTGTPLPASSRFDGEALRQIGPIPLEQAASIITSVWLTDALASVLRPRIPELQNTHGDKLVYCTSNFSIMESGARDAIIAALEGLPDVSADEDGNLEWLDNRVEVAVSSSGAASDNPNKLTIITGPPDGPTILGRIKVDDSTIELTTNSIERAGRGERMIAELLGARIGPPVREALDAREELLSRKAKSDVATEPALPEIPAEVERQIVHEHLDTHYRLTIDKPVPMLGNLSPREAAQTAEGRERLVAWMKFIENQSANHGKGQGAMVSYDFGWMWRELGIAERRA